LEKGNRGITPMSEEQNSIGKGCNNVTALLYAIADITEKKRDGKLAPTSMKCTWSNPRKRKLTPKKSQNLTFNMVVNGKESIKKKCQFLYMTLKIQQMLKNSRTSF
jgi:hypothetical protein